MCMVTYFQDPILPKYMIVFINRNPVNGNARTENAVMLVTNCAKGNHVTRFVRKNCLAGIRVAVSAVKTVPQNVWVVLTMKYRTTTRNPGFKKMKQMMKQMIELI